ncbi:MAG: O-antigen ligase family protein [Candidatus Izemoplasmatales bacterium]
MKQRLFDHYYALLLLSALTLFFWYFDLAWIGLPLYGLGILLTFLFSKDAIDTVPFVLNSLFMIKTPIETSTLPLYVFAIPLSMILGFVVFMMKNKTKPVIGKLFYPILGLVIISFISTINSDFISPIYFLYLGSGVFMFIIYFMYRSFVKGNYSQHLVKILFVLGMLVSIQIGLFYINVETLSSIFEARSIELGWGGSSEAATYLLMFIPATFFYAKISKRNLVVILIGTFEILTLFLTLSRGGILTFLFVFILLMIFLFRSSTWTKTLFHFGIALLIMGLVIYLNYPSFLKIFNYFKDLVFIDNGHIELYEIGISRFLTHPLLGVGIIARINFVGGVGFYYNFILQTLISFGILGFLMLLWQYLKIYQVMMFQIKTKTTVLGIAILGATIQGLVDNVYYMPQFMLVFMLIFAIVEVSNQHYDVFLKEIINS